MPYQIRQDELKHLILLKNNIKNLSPSDCRLIAYDIQHSLKKNISETTLKRFFGFANVQHHFSQFTLNTLIEYVGCDNEILVSDLSQGLDLTLESEVELIRQKATRITTSTLSYIRNRCTVPFELTITRSFAERDLHIFRESQFSYTSFISPPGYGKSILLCHLIQNMFLEKSSAFKGDIVMLISADHIFNKDLADLSLEDRIKIKLGLSPRTDLIGFFDELWTQHQVKFFFVVDGVSDLILNKHLKPKIFDRIADFISTIEHSQSVKLIINMRSTTWSRFYEQIRYAHLLKNKWFPGSFYQTSSASNVPPLTNDEIEQIFKKINPTTEHKVSGSLRQQLKFPFHIQWYYQLREEYPNFDAFTNIIYYEIIAKFIGEKIYNSTYATEKILFCKKIILLTNYGKLTLKVAKTELMKDMPVFKNAYTELLTDGIIMEEKHLEDDLPKEYVRFIQPHVFEYFQFIELYDLYGHQLNEHFFYTINKQYTGNQSRFQMLQWAARLMVKLYKFKELNTLLSLDLTNFEKNYLLFFIAENLKYRSKIDPNIIREIEVQQFHEMLIKHLVHFDFVDTYYNEAIPCLIGVTENEKIKLIYHTTLMLFDCLSLDQLQIWERLKHIKRLEKEGSKWLINPYDAINMIYARLWTGESVCDKTLATIEKFKDQANIVPMEKLPNPSETLSYFLMLSLNYLYGSQAEAIKIIAAIFHKHKGLEKTKDPVYVYFLSFLTLANARINPGTKTDQMESTLTNLLENATKYHTASYARSLVLCIKSQQSKNRSEYRTAIAFAEEFLKIHQANKLTVHELAAHNLMIECYEKLNEPEKVIEYNLLKKRLLQQKNISVAGF